MSAAAAAAAFVVSLVRGGEDENTFFKRCMLRLRREYVLVVVVEEEGLDLVGVALDTSCRGRDDWIFALAVGVFFLEEGLVCFFFFFFNNNLCVMGFTFAFVDDSLVLPPPLTGEAWNGCDLLFLVAVVTEHKLFVSNENNACPSSSLPVCFERCSL